MGKSTPRRKKKPAGKAPRRKITLWQRLLLVFVGISFLAVLEIVARLLPLDLESPAEGDPFVGFSELHPLFVPYRDADGSLRMKTAPGKLKWFNPRDFAAEKEYGTFRIFTLGGSTAYGRPFSHATSFSGWLSRLLNLQPGTPVHYEVINAGGISYASYRVVTLLKEMLAYEPDLFIIYTGHNEFLETRTYEDFLSQPPWLFKTRESLSHLETYRLLNRVWQNIRDNFSGGSTGGSGVHANVLSPEVETLLDRSVGLEYYQRDTLFSRGVYEHFRYNVIKMIRICQEAGIPLVFLRPVDNLKDFSPFKSQCRAELISDQRVRLDRLLREGNIAISERRLQDAIEIFRQAVALDSLFADARFYLGRAYFESGNIADARNSFLMARERDVCPLRAQEPIHDALMRETAKAGVDLLNLPALFRQRSQGGIVGKEMLVDHIHPLPEGNLLIALEVLTWMRDKGMFRRVALPDEESLGNLYREVMNSLTEDYFRHGIVNLAKVLTWSKKYREVFFLLENQWEMVVGDGQAQYMMGFVLQQLGAPQRAISHLQKALELIPGHRMALTTLATVYSTLGKTDSATLTYEKALGFYPEDIPLLSDYGILLSRSGQPEKALELFQRALHLNSNSSAIINNIGLVYAMQKMYPQAIQAFQQAIEVDGDDPQACHNLGIVYFMLDRLQEAEHYLTEAIRLDPEYASARNNLGNIYRKTARLNEAEEQFRLALIINPNFLEPYTNLAKLYRSTGRDSLAFEVARAGIERFPEDPELQKLISGNDLK